MAIELPPRERAAMACSQHREACDRYMLQPSCNCVDRPYSQQEEQAADNSTGTWSASRQLEKGSLRLMQVDGLARGANLGLS